MSIFLSAVAAAAVALSGSSGAVAEPGSPVQSPVNAPVRATPLFRPQPDASSWERGGAEGEIRFRVTVPTAESPTPVHVRFHWADRAKDVNNAAWDRDEDFIRGAQR